MKVATLGLLALFVVAPLPGMMTEDLTHKTMAQEGPAQSERLLPPDVVFGPVQRIEEVTISGVVTRVWEDEIMLRSFATSYLVDLWPQTTDELGIRSGDQLRVTGLREEEGLVATQITRQDGSVVAIESF